MSSEHHSPRLRFTKAQNFVNKFRKKFTFGAKSSQSARATTPPTIDSPHQSPIAQSDPIQQPTSVTSHNTLPSLGIKSSKSTQAAIPPQFDTSSTSFFPSASNLQIVGGLFGGSIHVVQNNDAAKELKPLYDKVSPNAILNKGGRADPVKCYPGTREEVIAKIEKWRRANHLNGHPIFWLSGPAGAGKSAIVQTIAERCMKEKVAMANFFFFRADSTRNHSGPVIATLLYQLFELFPELKMHTTDIATNNPVVFRQSMEDQFSTLIEKPLRVIRQSSGQSPLVVLIDGLDECGSDSEHGKAEQSLLLRILHDIATKPDPAFMVLVASRTEAHLTMTFNEIGASPSSIFLDDSYRPSDDIRLFLSAEFKRIRTKHSLKDSLDIDWPLPSDLQSVLDKSSGQFVYAATVIRFIANSPASPKQSLQIVLGLRPVTKTSPFATLDSLYTYILSQADDWKSVHDILAAQKIGGGRGLWLTNFIRSYCPHITKEDILSSFSQLTAIIQFKPGDHDLTVFHASLEDFLYDCTRAGIFYIDINAVACSLVISSIKQTETLIALEYCFGFLEFVTKPSKALDEFLISYFPNMPLDHSLDKSLINDCMQYLDKVYQSQDPLLHQTIKSHWQKWFDSLEHPKKAPRVRTSGQNTD